MTPQDLVSRMRGLLTDARAAAEDVETAAADIHRLGMKIYLALSNPQAQQSEAPLTAAYEQAWRAIDRLAELGREVDRAERELGPRLGDADYSYDADADGEADADADADADGEAEAGVGGAVAEAHMLVGAFRDVVDTAREREADYEPIVAGCAIRLRDFATFDTASLHVWLDLEGADLRAADEGLALLRRLEFDLATLGVTATVSELEQRRAMLG